MSDPSIPAYSVSPIRAPAGCASVLMELAFLIANRVLETPHLTAGHWSRDSERRLFVAGYQEGSMQERGQAITVSDRAEQLGYRQGLEEGKPDRRSGRAFPTVA